MKSLATFVLLWLFVCNAIAQSPLRNAERYTIGSEFVYANSVINGPIQDIESSTTWDFISSYPIEDSTTLWIEDVSKHDDQTYGDADYVEYSSDGNTIYCVLNDSSCTSLGFESSDYNLKITYPQPQTYMYNNAEQGKTFESTYTAEYESFGSSYIGKGKTTITLLGNGSLVLPSGTKNCHLVKLYQEQRDSNISSGAISSQRAYTYVWFEDGGVAPLVRYSTVETGFGKVYLLGYLSSSTLSAPKTNDHSIIRVYPNPAKTQLSVNIGSHTSCEYKITSTAGKCVMEGDLEDDSINIQDLQPGMFYLTLQFEDGTSYNRLIRVN